MRVPRVGDSGFASHLEDHKLLYVSLEILLLTTLRRSRTPWVQMLRKGGQVRTALCEKTKIEFSGHPTPQTDPPMHHKYPNHAIGIQYCSIVSGTSICLFKTPKRSMRWIDGVGVTQHIWRDFTRISES